MAGCDVNAVNDSPFTRNHDALDRYTDSGEYERIQNRSGIVTGQHRTLVIEGDKIGVPAGAKLPRTVTAGEPTSLQYLFEQTTTGVAVMERRDVSRVTRKALPVLEPAKFLERVNRDLAIGANRNPAALFEPCLQGKQSVAKIGLRTGTQANDRTGFAQRRKLFVGSVGCVNEAPAIVRRKFLQQPFDGPRIVPGEALVDFGGLFSDVNMHGTFIATGKICQSSERQLGHSAQTVSADPNGSIRTCGFACIFIVIDEFVRRHRESALFHCRFELIEASALVENWHVSQPDTRIRRSRHDGLKHRAGPTSTRRLPVQVVKFRYRCIAEGHHLRIDLACDGGESVGVDQSGKLVHLRAPAPESVPVSGSSLLGMTGKRTLERMAMGVRDTWDYNTRNKIIRVNGAADLG